MIETGYPNRQLIVSVLVSYLGILSILALSGCKESGAPVRANTSNNKVSSERITLEERANISGSNSYTLQSNITSENSSCRFSKDIILTFKESPSEQLQFLSNAELQKLFGFLSECDCNRLHSSYEYGDITFLKDWRYSESHSEPAATAINGQYFIQDDVVVVTASGAFEKEFRSQTQLGRYKVSKNANGEYFINSENDCAARKLNLENNN